MELREIPEFPMYKVSDTGLVWSDKRHKWLKGRPNREDGYLLVGLQKGGKRINKYIHRLVIEAFVPNPDNLPEVNHKDECKTNNIVSNLEWCDRRYNMTYGTRVERIHTPEINSRVKQTSQLKRGKPLVQMTLDGNEIARFCCVHEAARKTGFHQNSISNACNGKLKSYKGYRWMFLSENS